MQAKGKKVPALEKRSELYPDLTLPWQAFNELHRARNVGFDVVPLSVHDIEAWLNLHEIVGEERREIFSLVSEMDVFWVDWARQQYKVPGKKGK